MSTNTLSDIQRNSRPSNPRVALFVTCLVDLYRPSIGFAAVKLLEDAGCDVHVPISQTCCGQPAYNSGDKKDTIDLAKDVINAFEEFDYVVAPSGSCAGMLKKHYPEIFEGDAAWSNRVKAFASKVFELTSFLSEVMHVQKIDSTLNAKVTYHDSCAGLRELGISKQPRDLLGKVKGLEISEMKDAQTCCGFGGTFAVKYSDISNSIVKTKTNNIEVADPDLLLAGDLGCLLNMAGKLKRQGSKIEVRHVAEVLAGMTDTPPIGDAKSSLSATTK